MALRIIQAIKGNNPGNSLRQLRQLTRTEDYGVRGEYISNGIFPALIPHFTSTNQQIVSDAAMSCSFLLYQNPGAVRTALDAKILEAIVPLLSSNVFDAKRGASNALNDFTNESENIAAVVELKALNPLIAILEQHNEENITTGCVMNLMNILLEGSSLQRNTEKNTFKTHFDEVNAAPRFFALFNNNSKGGVVKQMIAFCLCMLYSAAKIPAEYLPAVNHVKTFISSPQYSDSHYACFSLSGLLENATNKQVIVDKVLIANILNNLRATMAYIVSNNCQLLRSICSPGLSPELKGMLAGAGLEKALQPLRTHREESVRSDVELIFFYFI